MMNGQLILAKADFERVPSGTREELHFDPAGARSLLASLAAARASEGSVIEEAFLLSTCNRTELYLVGDGEAAWAGASAALRGICPAGADRARWQLLSGDAAAVHLFRVAAGMESRILGDAHILQQVRQAQEAAREMCAAGPVIERLLRAACTAAKRIRTETRLGAGASSVGAAVVHWLRRFPASGARHVLAIGSGSAARDIAAHLAKLPGTRLSFTSRTSSRAEALAASYGGEAVTWSESFERARSADVVVAASSGRLPQLEATALGAGPRPNGPLLVLDVGVPANAGPELRDLPGVQLVQLESLELQLAAAAAARRSELPKAEAILTGELERWRRWWRLRTVEPAIKRLYQDAESIRRGVLGKRAGDAEMERVTSRLLRKLLNGPVSRLRSGWAGLAPEGEGSHRAGAAGGGRGTAGGEKRYDGHNEDFGEWAGQDAWLTGALRVLAAVEPQKR